MKKPFKNLVALTFSLFTVVGFSQDFHYTWVSPEKLNTINQDLLKVSISKKSEGKIDAIEFTPEGFFKYRSINAVSKNELAKYLGISPAENSLELSSFAKTKSNNQEGETYIYLKFNEVNLDYLPKLAAMLKADSNGLITQAYVNSENEVVLIAIIGTSPYDLKQALQNARFKVDENYMF